MDDRRFARFGAWVWAALFAAGAAFHLLAMGVERINALSPNPMWRHVLFLVVNGLFALGFARRWAWLWLPTTLLAAQQMWSHGSALAAERQAGRWDWVSLAVVLAMPVAVSVAVQARGHAQR